MIKNAIVIIIPLTILLLILNNNTKVAMDKCQKTHSYETCFNTLHR